MTPTPDLWRPFTSTEAGDGLRVLTLDGIPWWVRNLRRDADGVVRGECQAQSDGWIERWYAEKEADRGASRALARPGRRGGAADGG